MNTPEQIQAITEEAMHSAFAVLAERLDPENKNDLGGFFAYNAEGLAKRIESDLFNAASLASELVNSKA